MTHGFLYGGTHVVGVERLSGFQLALHTLHALPNLKDNELLRTTLEEGSTRQ